MATDKSVINLGLGKIAANRVVSINPPKSSIEKHCADGYPVWRDNELEIRTWYFALSNANLTLAIETNPVVVGDGRVYRYAVPGDMIRTIRDKWSRWEQRGQYIYSADATLAIPYIARVPEALWPPSFINVVACRVACECVEFATQSNTKDDTATTKYNRAVSEAARANAFVIGPVDIRVADENDEWIMGRFGLSC